MQTTLFDDPPDEPKTEWPLAERRGVLLETAGGMRVSLGALWASLTPHELCCWQCSTITPTGGMDKHGILPGPVELFLSLLTPEATPT